MKLDPWWIALVVVLELRPVRDSHSALRGRFQYGDLHFGLAQRIGESPLRGIHFHPHLEQINRNNVTFFLIPDSVPLERGA